MSCFTSGRCFLSLTSVGMGMAMTKTLVVRLNTAVLILKATRLMQVPVVFLLQALLIGVHWNILIKKADEYTPTMRQMVAHMASLVIRIVRSVDVEHIVRYNKQSDNLQRGVVSLKTTWLMYTSIAGHVELRKSAGMSAFAFP